MQRYLILATALALLSAPAGAQAPIANNPAVDAYRQLLAEANDRLVAATVEVTRLKAEVDKLKKPPPEDPKH